MSKFKDNVEFKHFRDRYNMALRGGLGEEAAHIACEDSSNRFIELVRGLHEACEKGDCKHKTSHELEAIYNAATSTEELMLWCYQMGTLNERQKNPIAMIARLAGGDGD